MYARSAAKGHPIYAELARETVKSAYNFALSDWFHPPVIHEIRHTEGQILVRASDNVMVTKLVIQVLGEENQVLEKGEATGHEGDWWEIFPTWTERRSAPKPGIWQEIIHLCLNSAKRYCNEFIRQSKGPNSSFWRHVGGVQSAAYPRNNFITRNLCQFGKPLALVEISGRPPCKGLSFQERFARFRLFRVCLENRLVIK